MNKDNKTCDHCPYDCDNTQHTTSFVIKQTDPELFCKDFEEIFKNRKYDWIKKFEVDYPLVSIERYINYRHALNPKHFYVKWKKLVEDELHDIDDYQNTAYEFNITEECHSKVKNDFAIVRVYLAAPTIPRMKQDIKVPLHDKVSLLGKYNCFILLYKQKVSHFISKYFNT